MPFLLKLYIIWAIASIFIYFESVSDSDYCMLLDYNPVIKCLYHNTKMNIFGCFIVTILTYIAFPLLFIPRSIGMFIYWVCHIGRKKGN